MAFLNAALFKLEFTLKSHEATKNIFACNKLPYTCYENGIACSDPFAHSVGVLDSGLFIKLLRLVVTAPG